MAEFTNLERAILKAICDGQDSLDTLITTADVTNRDNTGHGFYTRFDVDRAQPAMLLPKRLLDGPNVQVQVGDEVLLMGFILWFEGGYPDCLEGFQYGTTSGDNIDLKKKDLAELALLGPMP
jgi:hypothetical protein